MGDVKAWPKPTGKPATLPRKITRPCDHGLNRAINGLEHQLGTIEAYNRLVDAAQKLKAKIDAGEAKAQNPLFAVNIKGG